VGKAPIALRTQESRQLPLGNTALFPSRNSRRQAFTSGDGSAALRLAAFTAFIEVFLL
jgi:hypothetical protein